MNINPISIIFYVIILIITLTIHEFSHAWAGHRLGDITAKSEGRLSLNPMVHIDPFMTLIMPIGLILLGSPVIFGAAKPVPFNPYAVKYGKWGAALVALAGPASNLIMAVVAGLYLRFVSVEGLAGLFVLQFVTVNLAFFVFNMIPFPPLDGSRLLYAISPPPMADFLDRIEKFGLIAVFGFLLIFYWLIGPFMITIVGYLTTLITGLPIQ